MEMILLFLIVGCITGFFAGLLGIGGGAIIVPIVMYVVSQQAIPADMVMKQPLFLSLYFLPPLLLIRIINIKRFYGHNFRSSP